MNHFLDAGHLLPSPDTVARLWGKSQTVSGPLPLCQHLFDTAAMADLIWDHLLAPATRHVWDEATVGGGRGFFSALCALHDIGKATPIFQAKHAELAAEVVAAGLSIPAMGLLDRRWYHSLAGAKILRDRLRDGGWQAENVNLVWPFIAGHHGTLPSVRQLTPPGTQKCHAPTPAWAAAQHTLVDRVLSELGLSLESLRLVNCPPRAQQLALLGWLIVADWMASSDQHFPGGDEGAPSAGAARGRASAAWAAFALRRGWESHRLAQDVEQAWSRFGQTPRPSQTAVLALAERLPGPGLVLVEAPMGEGKTEAALGAVEVLARRFGADGVFVGMPTQATADPMWARVRAWAEVVDPQVSVALLHGKARFNPAWQALLENRPSFPEVDQFGCDDVYGAACVGGGTDGQAPGEWILGRKRALLVPVVVGTVDQLLYAATRTRHVMLRHAGLIGKVVVLDEVHAYDVYMSQFLHEALRWLGEGGVPVVILSATLPPAMRTELARAYLQGALTRADVSMDALPSSAGYPAVTSVCAGDNRPEFDVRGAPSWRPSVAVRVENLLERGDGDMGEVVSLLKSRLCQGGSALVIRNTVGRAQQTYAALAEAFPGGVVLLHSRLTAGERADRMAEVLRALGPGAGDRPEPLIVVATQLAEQSCDIDADLLITDLAPIDLLLQRLGRLHRHAKSPEHRPGPVRQPTAVVTGFASDAAGPTFPRGCSYVYGEHLLTRAAALVQEAEANAGWSIPADVPALVARGYADDFDLPDSWIPQAALHEQAWEEEQSERAAKAAQFLLAGTGELGRPTLAGLHAMSVGDVPSDDELVAHVRDGDPSLEVVLVGRDERGYTLMDGRPLGTNGEVVSDSEVLERLLRDAVRLPSRPEITAAAAELRPLPGWKDDPWLGHARALVLDAAGAAILGSWTVRYDLELGLVARYGPLEEGDGGRAPRVGGDGAELRTGQCTSSGALPRGREHDDQPSNDGDAPRSQ